MNTDQGQVVAAFLLSNFQQEHETTKKVIRAVPDNQMTYKPDPKAKSAHELAWHIATAEVWFLDGILAGAFSMEEGPAAPPTIGAIVDWYETNFQDRLTRLKNLPGENLVKTIPFFGMMELPAVAYLTFLSMHSAHHRGQLSTYLRPMGSKVPSIYGGSADEPMQM